MSSSGGKSGTEPAKLDKLKKQKCSRGWEVNVGALAVGSKGIRLKPQCMFGAQIKNFTAEVGIGDIRDGLSVSAKAEAAMSLVATGHSVSELHRSIRCDTIGLREALHTAKKNLAAARDHIAQSLGISQERVDSILDGDADKSTKRPPITLQVEVEGGVGLEGCVCLGWKDTKGYRMVGMAAKAEAAVLLISGKMFIGKHKSGKSAKIVIGLEGFSVEYTFPIGAREVLERLPSAMQKESSAGRFELGVAASDEDESGSQTRSAILLGGTAERSK